jgi:hypothetical protein
MHTMVLTLVIAISLTGPPPNAEAPTPPMSHAALLRGRQIEMKGRVQPDGSFEARRIRLRDADDAAKIEGSVTAVDLAAGSLVIGAFDVVLSADPIVQRGGRPSSLRELAVGQVVEAKGYCAGRLLYAWRLRIREPDGNADAAVREETEVEAGVEQVDPVVGTLVVLGRTVRLATGGKVVDERTQRSASAADRRLRRDDDDQQVAPIQFGRWLTIGGRVGGDVTGERNFNRDPDEPEIDDRASATGELLASALVGPNVELYARMRTSRVFPLEGTPATRSREIDLRVLEASLTVNRVGGSPIGFQIGRQRFRDAREWFFDEYLDAARVHVDLSAWRIEAAIVSGLLAGPEAARARRDQRQAVVSVARQLGKRTAATAFVIARDDRNRGERPMWVGSSVEGRAAGTLKYWGNAAVRRGRAGPIKLTGWAVDGAVAYRFPVPGEPAIAAGYAAASGDPSRSDGVDSNFRQTGLQDDTARFHGLKRFAYYGELFDPELSNMEIVTAGSGMRPFAAASIDVVYHRYRQRQLRRSLPSNALEAAGTGRSAHIGDEIDLVVSVQRFRPIDFSIVAGIFWPGAGMASPVKPARYWNPQIRLFF